MKKLIFIDEDNISWSSCLLITLIVYFVSHALMLSLYGAWWDDMLLWNVTPKMLYDFLGPDNFNNPVLYETIKAITSIRELKLQTFIFRLVAFVGNLIPIICAFFILRRITAKKSQTLLVVCLMAACGVNKAMIFICCYHYTFSNALFFIGLVYFVNDYYKSTIINRVVYAVFWFLSLVVWRSPALLIPFVVCVASILKVPNFEYKKTDCYKKAFINAISYYWPVILGCFVFVVLYKTILAPHGVYEAYYRIGKKTLVLSSFSTVLSLLSTITTYLGALLLQTKRLLFVLVLLVPIYYILNNSKLTFNTVNKKNIFMMLGFAFFAFLPQMLRNVSLGSNIDGYSSRQMSLELMPLSFLLYCFVSCFPKVLSKIIFSVLLSCSILYSINVYLDYNRYWAQKESIAMFLEHNPQLEGKHIDVVNAVPEYYAFSCEGDRNYDYEGCARLAYGAGTTTKMKEIDEEYADKEFNANYCLYIHKNKELQSSIKLYLYRLFNKEKYRDLISDMISFDLYPIKGNEYKSNN